MGIKLELTIAETNVVLQSLAKQSYETVASVIAKIQGQGGPQVAEVEKEEAAAIAEAATAETPAE